MIFFAMAALFAPERIVDIFLDESSQTKHRYLVIGGIGIQANRTNEIQRMLINSRFPELPSGEIKWTKVSKAKLGAYRRFLDVFFFEEDLSSVFDFHCIVIDTSKIKDRLYNEGSREIGFNKELYQLLMKFARLYRGSNFHAYPDARHASSTPEDLRIILNNGCRKTGDIRLQPFKRIHYRDSAREPILQVVDLFIGAIAFVLNGHYEAKGASEAKIELCDHILRQVQIDDVSRDTPTTGRFTIWHRRLK